ncbi:MAG: hypothetical protein AB8C84_01355 [Oligoflexales bacterium]
MIKTIYFSIFLYLLAGCGDQEDRYEVITKMRGIGVQTSPFAPIASTSDLPQTVTLTFYIAAPKGSSTPTQFENYNDTGSPTSLVTPALTPTLSNTQSLGNLTIFEITAQTVLPTADKLTFNEKGIATLRYGIKATLDSDEEIIVGNILIHAATSEVLNWTAHSVTIESITPSTSFDLNGSIANDNEKYKISWWAPAGKIKNSSALTTKIEELPSGPQTILFTARGMTSGSFAWMTSDIVVP